MTRGGNKRNARVTHPNRTRRQRGALQRQKERAGRSAQEQLAKLDREGHRALRERERLRKEG